MLTVFLPGLWPSHVAGNETLHSDRNLYRFIISWETLVLCTFHVVGTQVPKMTQPLCTEPTCYKETRGCNHNWTFWRNINTVFHLEYLVPLSMCQLMCVRPGANVALGFGIMIRHGKSRKLNQTNKNRTCSNNQKNCFKWRKKKLNSGSWKPQKK